MGRRRRLRAAERDAAEGGGLQPVERAGQQSGRLADEEGHPVRRRWWHVGQPGERLLGATPTGSATPEDEPSADTAAERRTTEAAATEADGLPVWVAPVALLVLAAGGGAAVWLRRRAIP